MHSGSVSSKRVGFERVSTRDKLVVAKFNRLGRSLGNLIELSKTLDNRTSTW